MQVVNACTVCTRLRPEGGLVEGEGELRGVCEAFGDGIPVDIWEGAHAHREAFGDEALLWDGVEEDHASYVTLYEALTGETPEGLPNPG